MTHGLANFKLKINISFFPDEGKEYRFRNLYTFWVFSGMQPPQTPQLDCLQFEGK